MHHFKPFVEGKYIKVRFNLPSMGRLSDILEYDEDRKIFYFAPKIDALRLKYLKIIRKKIKIKIPTTHLLYVRASCKNVEQAVFLKSVFSFFVNKAFQLKMNIEINENNKVFANFIIKRK